MPIGFSTGAVAGSDFGAALDLLSLHATNAVELSALRSPELPVLVSRVREIDLSRYSYVSVHAPKDFVPGEEGRVRETLLKVAPEGWPIVVHPDVVADWGGWRELGPQLLIENMDPRCPIGRTADELSRIFDCVPEARLCFDVAHARRFDTSMLEAFLILERFSDRLAEIHVSELDGFCRHHRLSYGGVAAINEISSLIPEHVPIIIESPVAPSEIEAEIEASLEALGRPVPLRHAA